MSPQVLPLTRHHPVHQLVNWCEVFPTRQSPGHSAPSTEGDTEARVFLLVVGLGHQVIIIFTIIITVIIIIRCSGSSWRQGAVPQYMEPWSGQTPSMWTR